HGRGRVEREGRVRLDARVVPALLFLEVGDEHVVGEDVAEGEVLVLRLFLAVRRLRDPDRVSHCLSPYLPLLHRRPHATTMGPGRQDDDQNDPDARRRRRQKIIGSRYSPKTWRYTSEISPRLA